MTFNWHDHFATSNDGVGDTRLMLGPVLDAAPRCARQVPRPGAGDHPRPRDAALPEPRQLREGRAQRELRPRAARALHARASTTATPSATSARRPARSPASRSTTTPSASATTPSGTTTASSASWAGSAASSRSTWWTSPIEHRAHAGFICDKLWGYFSPRPCPPALLRQLARTYRARRHRRAPGAARRSCTNKLFYASLAEPDMVKPPFVYVAGHAARSPGDGWTTTAGSGASTRWARSRSTRPT